ncbi:MAG: hypothetical protein KFB97_13305 [Cyanobium sp. M30B3]|nr:MAG: hypothetical protein KFB97_13305 [Cyanobium sp. M30B3]
MGRAWSMDRLLRPANADANACQQRNSTARRLSELGYIAQIVLIYWMAASHKSIQGWFLEGSAVWLAFHIDIFTWPAARQLLTFPALLQLFSRGAYLVQWAAPLLLIWPSRSLIPRLLGVGLLLSMHVGFLPFLKLGLFPWVSIVCLLPLVPGQLWDRLVMPRPSPRSLPTIYYDQDCRFCLDAATILTRLLRVEDCALLPAQSEPTVEALMREANSWVVQTADGSRTVEYTAFLHLCAASPGPTGSAARWPGAPRWAPASTGWWATIAAVPGGCSMPYAANPLPSAPGCSRPAPPPRSC